MNKIKLFSLFLISFFMMITSLIYADSVFEFGAEVVFPSFWEATIDHTPVNSVSSVNRILNVKSSVDFGGYVSATAQLLYYFDNEKTSVNTIDRGKISHKAKFYTATPKFQSSYDAINYQIKITLKKKDDIADYYAYWPSSDTFHSATITNSTTTYIIVSDGGSIKYESGNQEFESTKLTVPANALSRDTDITITQFEPDMTTGEMVALYSIDAGTSGTEIVSGFSIAASFYYGTETNATKFDLMYRESPTSAWEKVTISSVDTANKIVSTNITKFGEYAIFVSMNLGDNDYRPAKRIKVKSRIANGMYEGFRFRYLTEGDVVKIYNLNGKKIREITAGDGNGFVWDGRKDNGDWAESGTYVYQIKVKEKIVSGTIAFVW